MNRSDVLRLVGLLALIAVIAAFVWLFPVKAWLQEFLERIQAMGAWGPVCVALVYVIATVLCVPGAILSLGAGFAFGVVQGAVAASVGSTLGAIAAWLLGRTLARGLVERWVNRHPVFRALDQAIGTQGFRIVLLLRLSPVFPFNLLNYALALTGVRFRDYALGSWIGMLPATIMIVYAGSTLRGLTDVLSGGVAVRGIVRLAFIVLGLLATIAATWMVTRAARSALRRAVPTVDAQSDGGSKPE